MREDEILYVLRHLVTMTLWEGSNPMTDGASTPLASAAAASPRAHLFQYYPLILEIAFVPATLPSMWIRPDEHARLFGLDGDGAEADAPRDGTDLIEVSARDLARRALALVGEELRLGPGSTATATAGSAAV